MGKNVDNSETSSDRGPVVAISECEIRNVELGSIYNNIAAKTGPL